jgi:predicted lactoylglutathione lyase
MAQDLWLNLPVKDLANSIGFFTAIGFARTPGPGNSEHSASFTVGDKKVVLMLFTQPVFAGFTSNALSDTSKGTEVLFSLGADSRQKVDDMASRARAAGGIVFAEPRESNGFMYGCGFSDPDGHRWNVLFMDASKMPGT